jgi:hypothetical protein
MRKSPIYTKVTCDTSAKKSDSLNLKERSEASPTPFQVTAGPKVTGAVLKTEKKY